MRRIVRPSTRRGMDTMWNKDGNLGQKQWTGANPPERCADPTYYLKTAALRTR